MIPLPYELLAMILQRDRGREGMYLSAEQTAIAEKAATDTVEESSIASQAIRTGCRRSWRFRARGDNAGAPPWWQWRSHPAILPGIRWNSKLISFDTRDDRGAGHSPTPDLAGGHDRATVQLAREHGCHGDR